jgi:hypothetical protein
MAEEEPLPSGWLPPRPPEIPPAPAARPELPGADGGWSTPHAPAHPTSPAAPPRPPGEWPRPPSTRPDQPSSPLAVGAIAVAAVGLVLLVLSAGASYFYTILLSLFALALGRHAKRRLAAGEPGRPGQARAAIVLASVGLALAGVAALVWIVLSFYDITPRDLQETLEREAERLRRG